MGGEKPPRLEVLLLGIYWDGNGFGEYDVPRNWEEIVEVANSVIEEHCLEHGEDGLEEFSEFLWEQFCCTGKVGNVFALY